nr:MAG TPA: hypothetical protein [Caudoviricetes sp.]
MDICQLVQCFIWEWKKRLPDRRRPVSRPPTYSAYHAGDAFIR